ncbi:hypothetical protein Pan241w_27310 [Gimesia alba]|uniref:Uncharacterized protein n=1 Tax=Gimesia alba TaxID=2527973 RepID=A0A517RFJ3_9PLAN|nr:hypothetical protein [Gimesia alba]QDT42644.1 hypothetical protein Pan241w_27310 [Gimesia alba]
MRRWTIPLLVMFVMIGLLTDSLRSAPEPDSSEASVQELLKRVKQLEKRVEELEKVPPKIVFPQTPPQAPPMLLQLPGKKATVVPRPSAIPRIPDNWKRNQINGIEYYIVPLDAKKK